MRVDEEYLEYKDSVDVMSAVCAMLVGMDPSQGVTRSRRPADIRIQIATAALKAMENKPDWAAFWRR